MSVLDVDAMAGMMGVDMMWDLGLGGGGVVAMGMMGVDVLPGGGVGPLGEGLLEGLLEIIGGVGGCSSRGL